jgi:hypothetical protein
MSAITRQCALVRTPERDGRRARERVSILRMRASRATFSIALSVVVFQTVANAQSTPAPPAAATPPASPGATPPAPPSYPPPPGQTPPANPPPQVGQPQSPGAQPPPPGYQQPPPGYQQQPPPGYQQQPPPGYQQQPPPGYYQQPPPGYYQQPPPGYYQPPPPGYYPPPQAYYYPPPGYGQPPPPSAQRPPPRTHGFLAMPYIGVHSRPGETGQGYGPGATFGALIGGRLSPSFSLNGEMRFDVINFRNEPAGETWDATEGDLALSPLFHVQFPTGELVFGPKLGFFFYEETDKAGSNEIFRRTANGLSAGFNAGVFFAVNRVMSLGGMLSFTLRDPGQVCDKLPAQTENCVTDDYAARKVFGFHAAMLF